MQNKKKSQQLDYVKFQFGFSTADYQDEDYDIKLTDEFKEDVKASVPVDFIEFCAKQKDRICYAYTNYRIQLDQDRKENLNPSKAVAFIEAAVFEVIGVDVSKVLETEIEAEKGFRWRGEWVSIKIGLSLRDLDEDK